MTELEHLDEGIVKVYTGSLVETEFIAKILEENGIETIFRDKLQETMILDRPSISSESSAVIYVAEDDVEKALKIIEEYRKGE
jgi:hypothetical protein